MRNKVAEVIHADPEALAWFRYGASYAICLMRMVDFYNEAGRDAEADEVLVDLKEAGSGSIDTIAKNFLRLGVYWDEAEELRGICGTTLEEKLDVIRNK